MKELIVLIFCSIVVSQSSAQSLFVKYDFSKIENIESDEINQKIDPVKNGNFVIIKIDEINTFLYKVEIEGKQIELQTPIPSELQRLFRISEDATEETTAKAGEGDLTNALNTMKEINKTGAASILPSSLIKKCEKYIKISKKISKIKYQRTELIRIAKSDKKFNDIQSDLAATGALPTYKVYEEFIEYYAEVEVLYDKAKANAELAVKEAKTNLDATPASADLKKKHEAAKKLLEEIKAAAEKIEEGHYKIDDDNFLSLIDDILTLHDGLEEKRNFEVISPPIQMEGDLISYTITITPTKTNDLSAHKQVLSWKVDIPAKGGWKSDFSVGPALSFGNNSRDDLFFLQDTGVDTLVSLQQRDNQNSINPGIAAMMHFYPRTGKYAAYAFMFGVGAGFQSVSDVNLSVYLGGSIVLGKSRKIMISGGLSYLRVDRLKSPEFEVDQTYLREKINIDEVTEKVFRPSAFLSVSYNLTDRVEVN